MANSVRVCVEQFFSYVLNVIILTTDFLPAMLRIALQAG